MENKQTLIGEVTADQINAWKEQHGEVFAIKVNGHVCYLRKPTRRELSFATTAGKNGSAEVQRNPAARVLAGR